MERKGFIAGSFDPPTFGHLAFIEKAKEICDSLIIGVGINREKKSLLSLTDRVALLQKICNEKKIKVLSFEGLAIEKAKEINASYFIRCIRNSCDLVLEQQLAFTNKAMGNIETIFLLADPKWQHLNSTLVREILHLQGDLSHFVPKEVLSILQN